MAITRGDRRRAEGGRAGARGRVIAVVEPHRYTRVRDLFGEFAACFKDADSVIVTPLYSAGELPIDGIDHAALAEAIRATGHARRGDASTASAISRRCCSASRPAGDMVVCLGAGNSTEWAHALPEWLAAEPMRAGGARELRPIWLPSWRPRCPSCAAGWLPTGAGRHHLVSRRRPGAGAVHAGR